MKTKVLLNTLCISLLLCSLIKAQETVPQNILIAPSAPGKFKGFSIPFTDDNETTSSNQRSSFSLQFSETNISIPTFINMKSNGIWINNSTRSDFSFHCEASQTCKYQKPAQYTWQELVQGDQTQTTISGSLVKDKVSLGGSVTLPNADILLVNEFSGNYWTWNSCGSGVLGLSFRRPHPQVPTFFEYLKTEGIVEKSIFAIYLDKNYNGELTFGGFDAQKVESEFQYAKWKEDQDPETPGFSLPAKGIGYGNKMLKGHIPVVIDFDVDYVVFPELIINKIVNEQYSRGQIGNCDMIPFLEDVVIELYGMTLRIPPAAYLKYGENTYYEGPGEKKTVIDCSGLFLDFEEEVERPKIVLGRPFLKLFYTVFNHEEKTVGFSKIASLEKEYPFSEPAGDYQVMHYYLPLKVGGALAVLLIAKFCVILYFIRKTWKGPETSSEDLVSPKIDIGNPEYLSVNNGNQEDYQQDSHNIDVGKITIEEEKFYA